MDEKMEDNKESVNQRKTDKTIAKRQKRKEKNEQWYTINYN